MYIYINEVVIPVKCKGISGTAEQFFDWGGGAS